MYEGRTTKETFLRQARLLGGLANGDPEEFTPVMLPLPSAKVDGFAPRVPEAARFLRENSDAKRPNLGVVSIAGLKAINSLVPGTYPPEALPGWPSPTSISHRSTRSGSARRRILSPRPSARWPTPVFDWSRGKAGSSFMGSFPGPLPSSSPKTTTGHRTISFSSCSPASRSKSSEPVTPVDGGVAALRRRRTRRPERPHRGAAAPGKEEHRQRATVPRMGEPPA